MRGMGSFASVRAAAPGAGTFRAVLVGVPAIVAGLAIAAFASASHVDPVPGPGNPQENSCPDGTVGFKVEPVTSGTKTDGALSVVITTHTTAAGPTFDFTSNLPIAVVFVKGGTVSNRYDYSPSVKADDGLHSPVNPMNGTYFGLSHVIFCYQPALVISKTASASYTRTFEWDIDKSVTPDEWDLFTGGSGTSEYTVDVTRTGFTDSGWAASGTITITNPMNVPATIELVADEVSDVGGDIPMDVDCPVTLPHVLAPGATLVCTYSGSLPDGTDRINAAIIKAEGVPGGVATAPVDFGDPTTVVNGTVNVNDTNGMSWQFSNSGSQTYTRTFDCDEDKGTHSNTATIVQTGQSDSASVSVTCVPPPPQPAIDLVIVKTATSPTPLNGTVNYSLSVSNKGPSTATNVRVADPAPAGISYQTAAPSQGTCVVTAALVTCNLGTVNVGQTVTIAITARATSVGTHINTATVTGEGGPETNPADNSDTAQTVVPQPLQPPKPKPQPKPTPKPAATVCLSLTANPRTIPADGRPDRLRVVVKTSRKNERGIKVVVRGAGVNKSGRTGSKGVAVITVNPRNPGLITITAMEKNRRVCGARRIGAVGVFAPPLTG